MSEHRKFYRHPVSIPIKVESTDHKHVHQLQNISIGGLAFECDVKREKGDVIKIHVLIDQKIMVLGRVAWCRQNEMGHYDIGVEFVATEHESENLVEEVCQVEMYRKVIENIRNGIDISIDMGIEPNY